MILYQASRRLRRAASGPASGAHAIALTPDRKIILVRLRYVSGWRLPGGARGTNETPIDGALRELREEIGLRSHGRVTLLPEIDPALILVEDVLFRPRRWSWEVERVATAAPDDLPHGLSPRVRRWIEAARHHI